MKNLTERRNELRYEVVFGRNSFWTKSRSQALEIADILFAYDGMDCGNTGYKVIDSKTGKTIKHVLSGEELANTRGNKR